MILMVLLLNLLIRLPDCSQTDLKFRQYLINQSSNFIIEPERMNPHVELFYNNLNDYIKLRLFDNYEEAIRDIDSIQTLFLNDIRSYPSDSYILFQDQCSMFKPSNQQILYKTFAIKYCNVFKQNWALFYYIYYKNEWCFFGIDQHNLISYKINPMPLKNIKLLPYLFPDSSEYHCLDSIIHKGKFADLTKDTILTSIEFRADSKEWKLNDLDSLFKTYQYSLYSYYKFEFEDSLYKMYVFTTGFDIIDGIEFRHIMTVTFQSVDNEHSLLHSIFYNMIYGHPVENWTYPGK
jgi:hypothetical protein